MRSLIRAFSWRAWLCAFLLAFLLAPLYARGTTGRPAPQRIAELGNREAVKLLIHIERPDYPPIAKVNFIQGSVNLEIMVNAKGRVTKAHVVEGEPLLAVAAIHAVQKWLYRPYLSAQGPMPFTTDVVVRFALHTHSFWGRFPTDPDGYLQKQVRPPEVIARPPSSPSASTVPMKVLVGSDGKVLDVTPLGKKDPDMRLVRKNLQLWKFQPARWGALAVPWYITVQVPLESPLEQDASTGKH